MIIIDNVNDDDTSSHLAPRGLPKRHDGAAYEPLFSYLGTMILVSEGALRSSLHGPCVTFMRSELKFQV